MKWEPLDLSVCVRNDICKVVGSCDSQDFRSYTLGLVNSTNQIQAISHQDLRSQDALQVVGVLVERNGTLQVRNKGAGDVFTILLERFIGGSVETTGVVCKQD